MRPSELYLYKKLTKDLKGDKMNKPEALEILEETRQLRTDILEPLDISFEFFLRFGQLDEERKRRHIDRLIRRERQKINTKIAQIAKSRKVNQNKT
jgi:hypothetical protein